MKSGFIVFVGVGLGCWFFYILFRYLLRSFLPPSKRKPSPHQKQMQSFTVVLCIAIALIIAMWIWFANTWNNPLHR